MQSPDADQQTSSGSVPLPPSLLSMLSLQPGSGNGVGDLYLDPLLERVQDPEQPHTHCMHVLPRC